MATLAVLFNILKVVLGLGFVIFLHELGHFLVAKWSGVYVKSFSVGFPPTIWKKRIGETEYRLGLMFLGGYVSMLGEGPESEEDPNAAADPRSFKNQTVGEKVAILSAGVVMNLVLGLAFFMTTHMVGVEIAPAKIGAVQAGSPAYEAGLRTGDQIVAINGDPDIDYLKLKIRVSLSAGGRTIRFDVKRPGSDAVIPIDIQPKRQGSAETPNIGVLQSLGLDLAIDAPFEAVAGMEGKTPTGGEFKGLDTIVAAGVADPKPISPDEFDRLLVEARDKPLNLRVKRDPLAPGSEPEASVALPPAHFVRFGFRTEFGRVSSLQGGSVAVKAGFRIGDRILKVDGRDDLDPFDLPLYCFDRAGKEIRFVVARDEGGKPAEVEIVVRPDASLPWIEPTLPNEAFEVAGLGLALALEPKVAAVAPGSEAEKAGVKPGMTVKTVEVVDPKPEPGAKPEVVDLSKITWSFLFDQIQRRPSLALKFTFEGLTEVVAITPTADPAAFFPSRGLNRLTLRESVPPQPIGVAIRRGWNDTIENVVSIYAMIRSLVQGLVSPKNLAGLPRIAGMAYQSASAGVVPLLQFLGMLSINLAVLNFMPIPPLDGGQIAIILAEKVRGRPVPPAFFNIVMIVGLVLILGLMLFTNGQDIWILIQGK